MKKCYKCKQKRELTLFHKRTISIDGLAHLCKLCQVIRDKKRWNIIKTKKENLIKFGTESPTQYQKNKNNMETWKKNNPNYYKDYHKKRRASDLNYKIRYYLRCRLSKIIKDIEKKGSAVNDLGCSIWEFRTYLESKFQTGMTWKNWGRGPNKWNLDHIIPLMNFDLTIREQFIIACNYKNLQPLWQKDHIIKTSSDRNNLKINNCL